MTYKKMAGFRKQYPDHKLFVVTYGKRMNEVPSDCFDKIFPAENPAEILSHIRDLE